MTMVKFRQATASDAAVMHALVADNLEAGHLLPRTMGDIVAQVRSLVVDQQARGNHIGPHMVTELASVAASRGFATLCAFTHEPSHFVKMGFTIVPHMWVPEKIAHDCTTCPLFRRCGQYAVSLPLRAGVKIRPEQPAAVIYAGRSVAARRPNIERLHLDPVPAFAEADEDAVPA